MILMRDTFAYRYAHCIDWVQLGNDSFAGVIDTSTGANGGPGEYIIWNDQLPSGSQGCWSGAKEFSDIPSQVCAEAAVQTLQDWDYQQMWAILRGSALAGRPWRIIGPGIPAHIVTTAYGDSNHSTNEWKECNDTAAWCNTWQAWFDVHDRYTSSAVISQPLDDVMNISSVPDWITPLHLVSLEFGPELDKRGAFWNAYNQHLYEVYLLENAQCDVANGYWNDSLITPWRNAQFGTTFSVSDALNSMYLYDFTVACYGTTLQTASHEPQFDLSALRAQNVCSVNFHANELPEQFSIVKDELTSSAVPYHVNGFNPHPDDCVGCGN